ncbi:hypothetical protein YYG_05206 [Plasmodium vinckei petteri]|uniref:CIR protein PIR protein n=1 Tax=Plasmodium vinckei petteri TaxID=138298 RepID=W7AD02_PLAVN|nr:hypothetical protein YYG_05206 [Plasmodium vinckei petteri]
MNINEMNNFSYPFGILIYLYNATNANKLNCTNDSNSASEFATRFKQLNKNSNNKEGSSYNKILSTISNDYGNLKKKCGNFPSLTELTLKKSTAQNSLENSGKGSEQILGHTSEVTSSSSSISTTLIPGLSVVSVIPVFLGIAYKYSLFGIDKIFQRQYLRTKLKKVKKKMKLNI